VNLDPSWWHLDEVCDKPRGANITAGSRSAMPARLMNLKDYGVAPDQPADIIVLDTFSLQGAIAELPDILMGFKNGRRTFQRQSPVRFRP
jgi:hypothetical protein